MIRNNCQIEFDHFALVADAASAISVDPAKSTLFYFVPFLGAWISGAQQLRPNDPLQTALISEEAKQGTLRKVEQLKEIAGITKDIAVYISDTYSCSSYGGTGSFTSPVISIPRGFITENGQPVFEPDEEIAPPSPIWKFTPHEVLFLISREMAHIQSNNSLLRIAAKVFFIASLFFVYALSAPFLVGALLMLSSIALHLISEQTMRSQLDIQGVNILSRYFNDPARALEVGRSALQKMIDQNLERRETNSLCKVYITQSGNNLLDLHHPWLTERMKRLQNLQP